MAHISSYKELRVYQAAIEAAMRIFEISKGFPPEERYGLTDQIRRASILGRRGVSADIELLSLANSVIAKLKLRRLECG